MSAPIALRAVIALSLRPLVAVRGATDGRVKRLAAIDSSLDACYQAFLDERLKDAGFPPYFSGPQREDDPDRAGCIVGLLLVEMPAQHFEGLRTLKTREHRVWFQMHFRCEQISFLRVVDAIRLPEAIIPISAGGEAASAVVGSGPWGLLANSCRSPLMHPGAAACRSLLMHSDPGGRALASAPCARLGGRRAARAGRGQAMRVRDGGRAHMLAHAGGRARGSRIQFRLGP